MRRSIRFSIALLAFACAASFAASFATTAPAATTPPPSSESLTVFEGQLNGHQVSTVTLHAKAHTFHALLTDGRRVIVAFPSAEQQQLVSHIEVKGITVNVAAKVQSPSHKRRYIVGGAVVIVAIALAAFGLARSARRRSMREEEGPGHR